MKLTKEKLQQIIKEELENLVNEQATSDYDRAKEWLKGVHEMMKEKGKIVPMEMRDRLRGILINGGAKDDEGMIAPLDRDDVMRLENEAMKELNPRKDPNPAVSDEDSLKSMAKAQERDPERFTRGT
jgi:uncharacterized protein (DUF2344 family)